MQNSYLNPVEIIRSHSALSYKGNSFDCVRLRRAPVLISRNGGRLAADHFGEFRLCEAFAATILDEFHGSLISPKMVIIQHPQTGNCQAIVVRRWFKRADKGRTL